jgi:TPR repeat protein
MKIQHLSGLVFLCLLAGCTGTDHSACFIYENNQPQQAFELIEVLAEQGDADAQFLVGRMLELGEGVDQDIQRGISSYQKAVNQQHSCAMNNLAVRYKTGDHVPKDHSLAFQLTQKAALSQHPVTLTSLGEIFDFGQGTPVNKEMALNYYKQALENGSASALFLIGRLYIERGKTPQEKLQGLIWLFVFELWQKDNSIKLRSKGSSSSQEFKQYIDKMREQSSPASVSQAYEQAKEWYQSNQHTLLTRKKLIQMCCQNK